MNTPVQTAGRGVLAGITTMMLVFGANATEDEVVISPTNVVAASVPDKAQCISGGRFRLNTAEGAPKDGAFFFVRYAFHVATKGLYTLVVEGPNPGTSRSSRYSMCFDGGREMPVLRRQRVCSQTPAGLWLHEQNPVKLSAGDHTLEFRFRPDDRMRQMNRVREPFVGHRIEIAGLQMKPASPAAQKAKRSRSQGGLLNGGDDIVLFGDSITEEEFYGKHVARLLGAAVTNTPVRVYNAGVSLNRTWEGVERLERDVLSLHPQWAVLAFGVNDGMHMAPEEFARNYELLIKRLRKAGIKVVCATPSGMCSDQIQDGRWFHTPDRAGGFDRTVAYDAGAIFRLAVADGCQVADVYGAFTRSGLERKSLMANQWHPNDDGGRIFALAILQALGATAEDVAKSGDPKDAAMWTALTKMPVAGYPELNVKPLARVGTNSSAIVASSFTRNAVYAFDEAGKTLACVPVGHHPMGLAWNAARRELYVACEGSGRIEVISVPDFKLKEPILLGDIYPVALAFGDDGKALWSANFFGSSLSDVDLATRKVTRTVPLGALGIGLIAPPGGKLLVALAGEEAVFVDPAAGTILKRVKVSENPGAFCVDSRGRLDIMDTGKWTLSAVDVAAMAVTSAGETPYRARAQVRLDDGTILTGDWQRSRIVRSGGGRATPEDVAEVEFPLGLCRIQGW